jgi:hypothetical protein
MARFIREDEFIRLAYLAYRTMDGDDVQDQLRNLLQENGFTDEWDYDEDEDQ